MALQPVNFGIRYGAERLTIDRHGRIVLSIALRRRLNLDAQMKQWIAVLYDPDNDIWAIQKDDLAKKAPAHSKRKVDSRGYISALSLLRRYRINYEDGPIRYDFAGDVSWEGERYLSFERVKDTEVNSPRSPQ